VRHKGTLIIDLALFILNASIYLALGVF